LANTSRSTPPKVSDLTIKSAQVMDGIIVLKVADRGNPDRLFRINLGVNLDRLGFVSAGIHPMTMNPGQVHQPEMPVQGPSSTGGEQGLKGPRKTSVPAMSVPAAGSPNPSLPRRGPGAVERSSAAGPRRSPIQSGSSGPVSLRHDEHSSGWKMSGIQRQPVSETARAILQAHRRAPHLRLETCSFSKPRNPREATARGF
jgi:hypothetical protein